MLRRDPTEQEGLAAELIRVRPEAFVFVQLSDFTQFIFIETEVPDVKILGDARRRHGFRDHHQAAIEVPADDDLRRRFAVFVRQLVNNFLIEYPFTALCQRAPGLGLNFMRRIPGMKLTLLQQRMQFNLVYHRGDAGFINDFLQMVDLEITDADAFCQPLLL